jgi:hypothetical protein
LLLRDLAEDLAEPLDFSLLIAGRLVLDARQVALEGGAAVRAEDAVSEEPRNGVENDTSSRKYSAFSWPWYLSGRPRFVLLGRQR